MFGVFLLSALPALIVAALFGTMWGLAAWIVSAAAIGVVGLYQDWFV